MRKILIPPLLVASTFAIGVPGALASCLAPPPIEQSIAEASSIFVGTVIGLSNQDRDAAMEVVEVWKGPDLPAQLTITGAQDLDPNLFTSVDRTYEMGTTYLVFPNRIEPFKDDACTATQPLTAELEELRPPDVREPSSPLADEEAGSSDGLGILPWAAAGAAIAAAAVGFTMATRQRRAKKGVP